MASSGAEPQHGLPPEWDGLELAVRRLLDEHQSLRRRLAAAERRARELEIAVAQLRAGGLDPVALRQHGEQLEAENRALRARLEEAATRVRRLLARTHFLEEER
jgi:predicted RNase H-like nuclease (RuvC/YqgF family)